MNNLRQQVEQAKTSEELETIVNAIPKQENGHRTELNGVLLDCFWYIDLDTVEKQKTFLLKRIDFYSK